MEQHAVTKHWVPGHHSQLLPSLSSIRPLCLPKPQLPLQTGMQCILFTYSEDQMTLLGGGMCYLLTDAAHYHDTILTGSSEALGDGHVKKQVQCPGKVPAPMQEEAVWAEAGQGCCLEVTLGRKLEA